MKFVCSFRTSFVTEDNEIKVELKRRINAGNARYYSVGKLLSSRLLSKRVEIRNNYYYRLFTFRSVIEPEFTISFSDVILFFPLFSSQILFILPKCFLFRSSVHFFPGCRDVPCSNFACMILFRHSVRSLRFSMLICCRSLWTSHKNSVPHLLIVMVSCRVVSLPLCA